MTLSQRLLGQGLLVFTFGLMLCPCNLQAFREPDLAGLPNFDRRFEKAQRGLPPPAQAQAREHLRGGVQGVEVTFDPLLSTPQWIGSPHGFLSGADGSGGAIAPETARRFAPTDPHRAVKAFLDEHRELFGHGPEVLATGQIKREFTTARSGLKTLVWEQQLQGIPVFQGVLIAHLTKRGELVNLSSRFLPDADRAADAGAGEAGRGGAPHWPKWEPARAIAAAAGNLEIEVDPGQVIALDPEPSGPTRRQRFQAAGLAGPVEAQLTWLPVHRNSLRLCWEIIAAHPVGGRTYRLLVDATTGELWIRHCLTHNLTAATYQVFDSDSPSPFSPGHASPLTNQPPNWSRTLVVTTALDTNASPNGWITDGTYVTAGNNVRAQLDRNGDNAPDLPRPQGTTNRVFSFPLDLSRHPTNHGPASVVQLFYWCNWLHDTFYQLGFTELAGNFQLNNFGRGGLGNDALEADAQDGAEVNNANMTTLQDGVAPRLQMFLFNGPNPPRDSALDAEVIFHEYTHGLTTRRVGGGLGLSEPQSAGLGEGWSDFYALTLLSEETDDPRGNYAFGAYISYLLSGLRENYYFGIRRYPYTTDLTRNPLTFKDIDPTQDDPHTGVPRNPTVNGGPDQIHRQGEVWASALWETRFNLIQKHGFAAGNELILQLVTDGLNLTPPNPDFLQARNAILQADLINNNGANREALWAGFAKRGMGLSAVAPPSTTTVGVQEAFDIPDNLTVLPGGRLVFQGPTGGPFRPHSQTFQLFNLSTNDLPWAAGHGAPWLQLSPAAGAIPPGATNTPLVLSLRPEAYYLGPGIFTNVLQFTNLISGRVQDRPIMLRIGQPDSLTELFDRGDMDLASSSLTWVPDGSPGFYRACREPAAAFPTDPAGGNRLFLEDDGFEAVPLTGGTNVWFFGTATTRVFVGSNGYITFGGGDNTVNPTLEAHFSRARLSALFADLDPASGGEVSWKPLPDRIAVTYLAVPRFRSAGSNSFQVELFFNGTLRVTWLNIDTSSALVGLSPGSGLPEGFLESDLSTCESCTHTLAITVPENVRESDGALPNSGLVILAPPPATNLTLTIQASDPAQVETPLTHLITAGQSHLVFDLTVVDDALLDGSQRVHLTASAPGYATANATTTVSDNESALLGISLPSAPREGDGPLSGTLTLDRPVSVPVRVQLASSDPTELAVPSEVVIPTGANSVVVSASVVDDPTIDGPQPVEVTAGVENWVEGATSLSVLDNENTVLSLAVPGTVHEASGLLPQAGRVQLSGTLLTNLAVTLESAAPGVLVVTNRLSIQAGQSNAAFDLLALDNATLDGPRTVILTARAAGWSDGSATVQVFDDELPPEPRDPVPADRASGVPVTTDLSWTLVEPGGGPPPLTLFDVYLGTSTNLGPRDRLGATTNLSWALPPLGPLTVYYWKVVARRLGETSSPIWTFTSKGVDHFVWSPIAARQRVGTPWPVSLGAQDEFGTAVSNFNGVVRLESLATAGRTGPRVLISEVDPGTPDSVEFVNVSTDTVDLSGWRIWIYDLPGWPDPSFSFTIPAGTRASPGAVFRLVEGGVVPGAYPAFSAGVNFSWVHGLEENVIAVLLQDAAGSRVDFVCAAEADPALITVPSSIPGAEWADDPLPGMENPAWSYQRTGAADQDNSLDWITALATPGFSHSNLALPFRDSVRTVLISPTNASPFVDGRWSGEITGFEPAEQVVLRAEDSDGHVGVSNPFRLLLSNDVVVILTTTPSPVVVMGSNLLYQAEVFNAGPSTASALQLTNILPDTVRLLSLSASQGTCSNVGSQVFCSLGDLPGQSNLIVSMLVVVDSTGLLTNQVVLTQATPDPDPTNNRALVILPAVPVPELQADNALLVEGNEGTNLLQFKIRLSTAVAHEIRVDYLTADSGAEAGYDYLAAQGVVVFPAGSAEQVVTVPVLGDTLPEANETLLLLLTNAVNAVLTAPGAVGTILNDDPAPWMSLGDAIVQEGDTGTTNAVFPVTLSHPSALPITVRYATFDVTAQAGLDYTTRFAILQFPPGTTNLTVAVPVLGDPMDEPDETFFVALNSATNATILRSPGIGTILDDDPLPVLSLVDTAVLEGDSDSRHAKFAVILQPPSARTVTVQFATSNETATAGSDYAERVGSLVFEPGVFSQFIEVPVFGDDVFEPDETFLVGLSEPELAELGQGTARGTIVNDDTQSGLPDRFLWEPLSGPQQVGAAFSVQLACLDRFGEVARRFNGTARLRAFAGGGTEQTLLGPPAFAQGSNTGPVTVGFAFTPSTNLLVTHLRHFFGSKVSIWTDSGDLLASAFVDGPPGEWTETPLSPPLALPAHHRYRLGAYSAEGADCFWRTDGRPEFAHGTIDHSAFWEGDQFPISADPARWYLVDLRYQAGASQELPVTPHTVGPFTNGLWSGAIQIDAPAREAVLWAEDDQGHRGASDRVEVKSVRDLGVALSADPSPVVAGEILRCRAVASYSGPGAASNVVLRLQLPDSVDLVFGFSSQGTILSSNNVVVAEFGDLTAQSTAWLHVEGVPRTGGTNLAILADASFQDTDPVTNNNAATVFTSVLYPVTIVAHPQNQSVTSGSSATMSVQAFGEPPLRYQWWHGHAPIPGATNAFLSWPAAQLSDEGDYHAVVSDGIFQATSHVARLTVNPILTTPGTGFINVTVPPGYSLLANMLPKDDNAIGRVLPFVPRGTTVLKVDETGFVANNYLDGWTDPGMPLPPGEGFFFKNPLSNGWVLAFTGKILGGYSTNQLPAGLSLCASIPAQQGPLSDLLRFPAASRDMVFLFDQQLGAFRAFRFLEDQWFPAEPTLGYGQSFFARKDQGTAWIRFSPLDPAAGVWENALNPVGHTAGQVNLLTFHPDPARGRVVEPEGALPLAGDYAGQLYGGLTPEEAAFQPLGHPVAFLPGATAGYLRGGLVTIPGSVSAQTVFVQLRVWHVPSGATYETALANLGPAGRSEVMALTAGAALTGRQPGLPPPDANAFASFAVARPHPTNTAPTLAPLPTRVVHAQTPLILTNSARDNETALDRLVFSLSAGPLSSAINSTNGLFTWTPTAADVSSTNWVTIRVTDDGDPPLFAEETFMIVVVGDPLIEGLAISNGLRQLSWRAAPGTTYRVQYKSDLGDPAWTDLAEPIQATNFSAYLQDATGSTTQRFYRIGVIP